MNRTCLYILLLVLVFVVVIAVEVLAPRPVDWTPSFVEGDTRPYGSQVVYDVLPALFGEEDVRAVDVPIYLALRNTSRAPASYLFVTKAFAPDEIEARQLLRYASRGQQVFIAANDFSGALADSLGLEVGWTGPWIPGFTSETDSTRLRFVNPALQEGEAYHYPPYSVNRHFDRFDTMRTTVLGTDDEGSANYIRVDVGQGAFYLSTVPLAFTNYNMLRGDNAEYVYKALAYLPEQPVWWDAYYKPVRTEAQTPLRFILRQPALQWAYYVGMVGLLLFVVFQARRRQRPIPVIEPPHNATREFVETVGRFYFQYGDHANLARKKITYFYDYIRTHLNLSTHQVDNTFVERVAERSGVPLERVQDVFAAIWEAEGKQRLSKDALLHLAERIEDFYQRSMR